MTASGPRTIHVHLVVAVLAAALLALASGSALGVRAVFTAQEQAPGSAFATTALYAPTGLTATATGHRVNLGWSAGTNGDHYSVLGVANGTSSDCTGVTETSVGSTAALTYTDARFTPQGTYFCYEVQTAYGSWTSVDANPTAAVQLGFFAASVVVANGGTAARLDTGDRITVTFNQPVATGTGPSGANKVCSTNTGVIRLGATATTGVCSATEPVRLGGLTGATTAANGRWNATWTWSAGNTVLTVVLGTRVSGTTNVTTSGAWTFAPVATTTLLRSAAGSFHVCDTNSGGGNCRPVATGSF
jgi:hypothetical protein